jgi:hypothetical protein
MLISGRSILARFGRRTIAVAGIGALTAVGLVAGGSGASAITGDPGPEATLPAAASSIWQTNDAVWSLAYSNGVLFAGGDFTSIRPPGSAKGSNEAPMSRLAAFNAATGEPCTAATPCPGLVGGVWKNPGIDARVWSVNVSPDGKTLYAGGDFIYAQGKQHRKAAAFDLTKAGAPVNAWNPVLNGTVRAIASTGTTVYLGGAFTTVNGVSQPRLAAFDRTTLAFKPSFAPVVDGSVYALTPGPSGNDPNNLVLGGTFRTVNGQPHSAIAQVDYSTGTVNGPMSNTIIPGIVGATRSDVKTLITDSQRIYAGAEGTGHGIFDGQVSVDPTTGNIIWKDNCLGATQALALIGNDLYIGSHTHDCASLPLGGLPQNPYQTGSKAWHHLLAQQAVADPGNPNTGGQLLTWWPVLNAGPTNGATANELGPRALATDGTSLFVGGQSTTVNGVPQQGLTRFTPGGTGLSPTTPVVTANNPGTGTNTIRFTSSSDPDDRYLTYTVTRSDGTVVYSNANVYSPWWVNQAYVVRDRTAPAGSTYTVKVTDAAGLSASTTVTPILTSGYKAAVLANTPTFYWRLDETSGIVAKDSSGHNLTGTYRNAITLNKPGAIDGDAAITEGPALSTNISQTAAAKAPPATYSLELWFRTTSTSGGRLIGWSNAASGQSAHPDRTIYMGTNGQLLYTTFQTTTDPTKQCAYGNFYYVKNACYAWAKQDYNDGGWHHVVATQSPTQGMILYVDGVQVATMPLGTAPATYAGLWRVGGDVMTSFPRAPKNNGGLAGDIDEVAVYPTVLTPAQVLSHYQAGQ